MLSIGKQHADDMIAHALDEDPNECCGILAGKDEAVCRSYRIANTARSPYRYMMDPQEQLNAMLDSERNEWDFLALYHSHTHGPAYPSPTDVRLALEFGWLDVRYVLVSLQDKASPQIRTFRIMESGEIAEDEFALI